MISKKAVEFRIRAFFKKFAIFLSVLIFFSLLSSAIPGIIDHKNTGLIFADPLTEQEDNISKLDDNEINISADAAVIMDYDSGKILWEKNYNKRLYPASTTKMLTAIVAIENIKNFNEIVTISKNAAGRNNSFFAFNKGDKISILDLLKAALINSNNNATIALAEYVSGNENDFVKLMNAKASEIGAYDTFYQNTNGLDSNFPDHKTTAKDLAVIAGYCMKNDLFTKIVGTKEDTITINDEKIDIFNTNVLLFFDYIKGVKTGFTDNAGYCIVLYSDWNGLNLISVVLNSTQGQREADVLKLINWANDNYKHIKIVDSTKMYKTVKISTNSEESTMINNTFIDLYPQSDFTKLLKISDKVILTDNINKDIKLPIQKNQNLGSLIINVNNREVSEIKLVSRDSVEVPYIYQNLSVKKDIESKNILFSLIAFYFLIFIIIIVKNLIFKEKSY